MSELKTKALEAVLKYAPNDAWIVPLVREALEEATPALDFETRFKLTRAYARLIELRSEEYIFRKDGDRYGCGTTDDAYDMWKIAGLK